MTASTAARSSAASAIPKAVHKRPTGNTLGGFTDATFTAMAVLEAGRNPEWPF